MTRWPVRLLLVLLCLVGGCTRSAPPNVLIVLIDTLRPDRLGAYGSGRDLTPFIDSLAQRGYVFRHAYAQTSWTNASVASLFTSRYQSQHRITSFNSVLGDQELTLAEVLKDHGYRTGGFVANFLIQAKLGFGQGFDQYQTFARTTQDMWGHPSYYKERAERINHEGLAWLDQLASDHTAHAPIFLYLHYMEPHNPYDPPQALVDKVVGDRPRPDLAAVNDRMTLPNLAEFDDDMVRAVQDFYDAEVMSMDMALRDLFASLEAHHFLDNAVVVVTADHGEEFKEHGLMGHHQTLYEEVIHVPLIVLVPGQQRHVEVNSLVSLTDVAPTVLDLVGIPRPASFMGSSLRGVMGLQGGAGDQPAAHATAPDGVAFSELIKETTQRQRPHERAVVSATGKLILDVDGTREFYDLKSDPGEHDPQGLPATERGPLTAAMSVLQHYGPAAATPQGGATPDEGTRERMRALGYGD